MNIYDKVMSAMPQPVTRKGNSGVKRIGMYNGAISKKLGSYNEMTKKRLGVYDLSYLVLL